MSKNGIFPYTRKTLVREINGFIFSFTPKNSSNARLYGSNLTVFGKLTYVFPGIETSKEANAIAERFLNEETPDLIRADYPDSFES